VSEKRLMRSKTEKEGKKGEKRWKKGEYAECKNFVTGKHFRNNFILQRKKKLLIKIVTLYME
jgi:hypothetical protein